MTKDNLPVLQLQVAPVVARADALDIQTPKDMEEAANLREFLKKVEKTAKTYKEKITKPLNEALKEVRGRYAPFESTVEEALTTINQKMGAYQTAALAAADLEAKKIADKTSAGKLKPETAVRKLGEIDTPAAIVESASGSTGFMAVKKFEVVDFAALPDAYKVANDTAIRAAMRDGVELAGVRYWTEQVPKTGR